MKFIASKMAVVLYAGAIVLDLGPDLQSITITKLEKSEDYSVSIVTNTSSEDIVKKVVQNYFETLTIISTENTQVG